MDMAYRQEGHSATARAADFHRPTTTEHARFAAQHPVVDAAQITHALESMSLMVGRNKPALGECSAMTPELNGVITPGTVSPCARVPRLQSSSPAVKALRFWSSTARRYKVATGTLWPGGDYRWCSPFEAAAILRWPETARALREMLL
jgi:hypothetical protein